MWHLYGKVCFGASFLFLTPESFEQFMGRYDLKTEKNTFLACNCLISSHRIKCNISIERSHQYLHFSFSHQQALSNLRVHYDAKTEENAYIFLVTVSFIHTESSVIPLLKALIEIFLSFPYADCSEQLMRTLWPKNLKIWWFNCAMCSLIDCFCSTRLVFKITN